MILRSMRKWMRILSLSAVLAVSAVFPAFAQTEMIYVNCDVLRCRSSAEIQPDNIVARLYRGQSFQKISEQDGWVEILYNGTNCYVSAEYVAEKIMQDNEISLSSDWKYAEYSAIHTGKALLYRSAAEVRKDKTICVNAGHGTSGGSSVKTLCHPDGTPKVTGGTTGAGATKASAVSGGMTFSDGTAEADVTLSMALILKEKLLAQGYDVLMIRETDDVQLDNIARTVIANQQADCHIALHWDSTTSDKGAFYMSVPNVKSYREMEPVASNWEKHHKLGDALIAGLKEKGIKIFSGGSMEMDLTQTSYSTIPSVDIELGDKASNHAEHTLTVLADGLVIGVNQFFEQ